MKLIENYVICDGGNIFSNGKLLSRMERCNLASNTINPELLEVLSQDDGAVRGRVALNPSTPIDILKILSQDETPIVRRWANHYLNWPKTETIQYYLC